MQAVAAEFSGHVSEAPALAVLDEEAKAGAFAYVLRASLTFRC
jgi:hypothetical protein